MLRDLTHTFAPLVLFVVATSGLGQDLAVEDRPLAGLPDPCQVRGFAEGGDECLWLAATDALYLHDGGSVTRIDWPRGLRGPLAADADGVWLADDSGVHWHPRDGSPSIAAAGAEGGRCTQLLRAAPGFVYGVLDGRLARFFASPPRCELLPEAAVGEPIVDASAGSGQVWFWSREHLWRIAAGTVGRGIDARFELVGATAIPCAASRGENLVAVDHGELVEFTRDGRSVLSRRVPENPQQIAVRDRQVFVREYSSLHRFDGATDEWHVVSRFTLGQPRRAVALGTIFCDRQGILWIACDGGVSRMVAVEGIDNFVLPGMDPKEAVLSLAEAPDHTVWAGTNLGGLHERAPGGAFERLPMPFEQGRIEALCRGESGELWVGTRAHGLWCLRHRAWERFEGALPVSVRCLTCTPCGTLWIGTEKAVFRWRAGEDLTEVPLDLAGSGRMVTPGFLVQGVDGGLWLGTFRGGLLRFDAEHGRFVSVDAAHAEESVTGFVEDPDKGRALVLTTRGLWQLDHHSGAWDAVFDQETMRRYGLLMSGIERDDGCFWITSTQHLLAFDLATRHFLRLPRSAGSHPLGYVQRAVLARAGGESWFGARGGYTRVASGARIPRGESIRTYGYELVDGSGQQRIVRPADRGTTIEVLAPIHITPIVVDRRQDQVDRGTVLLHGRDDLATLASGNGAFESLVLGQYDVSVTVPVPAGGTITASLGSIQVRGAASANWLFAFLAIGVPFVFVLGVLWLGFRQGRSHALDVDRLLRLAGPDAERFLDLAFLTVAVAAACRRTAGASGAVVFACVSGGERCVRLSEEGEVPVGALGRAHACARTGSEIRAGMWTVRAGEREDVALIVGDIDALPHFEILLAGAQRLEPTILDRLEAVMAPVQAALHKQEWIESLQSTLVARSVSLESDLHDLRGKLTALRMQAFLLARSEAIPARQREEAKAIAHTTERVVEAVDRLQRRPLLELAPTDPAPIVREVVEARRPSATAKAIRLTTDCHGDGALVALDDVWFRRALENLIGNAIKFAPPGGRVQVQCSGQGGEVQIAVEDDGAGFTPSDLEILFLPSARGSAAPTGGESKSGMGLWIARQAIRAMGGRLWLERGQLGGARVCVALPRAAVSAGR